MKALVLYDSTYGNTTIIAETLAEEIAGKSLHVSDFTRDMLDEIDTVVVGSPIHGGRPSAAMSQLLAHLEKHALTGKGVAAFDTGYSSRFAGNVAGKIVKALRKAGGTPLIAPQKFIVESEKGPLGPDEIVRAKQWAQTLKEAYARSAHVPTSVLR